MNKAIKLYQYYIVPPKQNSLWFKINTSKLLPKNHRVSHHSTQTTYTYATPSKEEEEEESTAQIQHSLIRLSKRMSQLNLCSRREADDFISQSRVLVNGKLIEKLGTKVVPTEMNIRILNQKYSKSGGVSNDEYNQYDITTDNNNHETSTEKFKNTLDWDEIRGDTVMLHKPKNYVSGQPDAKHSHEPAVRLLTRNNIYFPSSSSSSSSSFEGKKEDQDELRFTLTSGKYLHFARKKKIKRRIRNLEGKFDDENKEQLPSTLINYAPAGRLDLDSTGVLIFTKNGVIAKHILGPNTEKEYIVDVEPVTNITRHERNIGIRSLPYPPQWDLNILFKSGNRLWNDRKPLKPVVCAQWIEEGKGKNGEWDGTGKLKIVLQEGRKRQIRRMCREFLGLNVNELKRVRVGSVKLGDLPEGRWRTLTENEVRQILTTID